LIEVEKVDQMGGGEGAVVRFEKVFGSLSWQNNHEAVTNAKPLGPQEEGAIESRGPPEYSI